VCCSVLQCVAVCCSVLQCVAVCCSVLQRVAAYVAVCVAACAAECPISNVRSTVILYSEVNVCAKIIV